MTAKDQVPATPAGGKHRAEELMTARVDRPGENVNAELDPEVAARAEAQVAENERLERQAAYDDLDTAE